MKKILRLLIAPFLMSLASPAASPAKLFVAVNSDKTAYKCGEPMAFALTVLNTNTAAGNFGFNSSKRYDFFLYDADQLVWKWSEGRFFNQALANLTLDPQIPLTYIIIFNQVLSSGSAIGPGHYQLKGAFCTREQEYLSDPIDIEISN